MDVSKVKWSRDHKFTAWTPDTTAEAEVEVEQKDGRIDIRKYGRYDSTLTVEEAVALYHALDSWLHAASGGE